MLVVGFAMSLLGCELPSAIAVVEAATCGPKQLLPPQLVFHAKIYIFLIIVFFKVMIVNLNPVKGNSSAHHSVMFLLTIDLFFFLLLVQFCYVLLCLSFVL